MTKARNIFHEDRRERTAKSSAIGKKLRGHFQVRENDDAGREFMDLLKQADKKRAAGA